MTTAERDNTLTQISDAQAKIKEFDRLADEIASLESIVGKVRQVNFISDEGQVKAVSDPDMLSKAEAAIVKLLGAAVAEQGAL